MFGQNIFFIRSGSIYSYRKKSSEITSDYYKVENCSLAPKVYHKLQNIVDIKIYVLINKIKCEYSYLNIKRNKIMLLTHLHRFC